MRCSRRYTSNVPTQCYALARRKSTPRHHTTPHIYVVLTYRTQPWPSMRESRTFAPFSEKLSGVGHEIHRRNPEYAYFGTSVSADVLVRCTTFAPRFKPLANASKCFLP